MVPVAECVSAAKYLVQRFSGSKRYHSTITVITIIVATGNLLHQIGKDLPRGHRTFGCLLSRRTLKVSVSPTLWPWRKFGCVGRDCCCCTCNAPSRVWGPSIKYVTLDGGPRCDSL